VRDEGTDGTGMTVETTTARRSDAIAVDLRAGGGFVARFEP
jgi:hypothetical protein